MSLKLEDITISEEYEKLVPSLPNEEYNQLKSSIRTNGLYLPIIINQKGVILDGHHRHKICLELTIQRKYKVKKFENKTDEIIFVGECNLQRRQLTPLQRIALVSKLEPFYKEKAKERMNSGKKLDPEQIFAQGRIRKILGNKANVSHTQYEKGKKILETNNVELISNINDGKKTITKAYQQIIKQEKKEKRQLEIKKLQVKLPENVQLYNKPFQELKIKNNSVSLIFTDPPYAEKDLYLYKDLAKQAARVLRDGGSLMCYVGHFCIDRVLEYMKAEGLRYHWIISVVHSGPSASVFGRKILVGYKPILWFTKGKYEGEFVRDCIKSEFQGKELHEWAQSTTESDYYIKYMTLENDIVYDPFLGQGTFGVSAVKIKRQFIGSEINPEHFENAKRLLTIANKS